MCRDLLQFGRSIEQDELGRLLAHEDLRDGAGAPGHAGMFFVTSVHSPLSGRLDRLVGSDAAGCQGPFTLFAWSQLAWSCR
jgi:hypothetical protein